MYHHKERLAALAAVVGLIAGTAGLGGGTALAAAHTYDCSPGHHAGACVGLQRSRSHPNLVWLPNLAVGSVSGAGTIKIVGPARLDVPSYTITSLNQTTGAMTERFQAGPGLVKSWRIPGGGAGASVYVVPNHPNQAGSATITVSVPGGRQTAPENGRYTVSWPAMAGGSGTVVAETTPFRMSTAGNTTPVELSANRPVFARAEKGPWVRALTLTTHAGYYWFRTPAHPAGLIVTTASEGGGAFSGEPTGSTVALAMRLTVPQPAPIQLAMTAASKAATGQWIPVTVHATQKGRVVSGTVTLSVPQGPPGTHLRASQITLDHGVGHDAAQAAQAGLIVVSAQLGSARAAAHIAVHAAPTHPSAFPWWILILLVAAAMAAYVLRRRVNRRQAMDAEHDTE